MSKTVVLISMSLILYLLLIVLFFAKILFTWRILKWPLIEDAILVIYFNSEILGKHLVRSKPQATRFYIVL